MAKRDTFLCSVVTPERQVLECEASFAAFPAHDGEIGVLIDRAPIVCRLGIGIARFETGGETKDLYIDGGFAQVVDNRLTILTEQATQLAELDASAATEALTEAYALPHLTDDEFDERQRAIQRAQVQIRFANK